MTKKPTIRDTVLKSLSAVGALDEARFYADLFAAQDPERFALIVLDPRCLKNPLLESLISNIRILSDLGLYPVLLVGALDDDRTSVRFQSQRLAKELESVSVKTAKLNTASYGLVPEVRQKSGMGRLPILEMTEQDRGPTLLSLAKDLRPAKIIFLQPSGGITQKGRRVAVVNIDHPETMVDLKTLSTGQTRFMETVKSMAGEFDHKCVYVIASPLNLLAELFTTKGSGTMIRKGASILQPRSLDKLDRDAIIESMETAFNRKLRSDFLEQDIFKTFIDSQYRGGAILTRLDGLPYLSKFWVIEAAQGEGIARDIWDVIKAQVPAFFWRSRRHNPFNEWYMRHCDGMQVSGEWRVFWVGLSAPEIPGAILAATHKQDDFIQKV